MGVIAHFADCIVVTHDNKILLQQRPETGAHPGALCAFGGHVEDGETVIQALVREIHEELGAVGDLNGDGKDEVALVWLTMGPTYWRNTLTVFTPVASGEYTTENDSTFSLIGEAKAPQIKDGVILIEQVVHAENDPICCPTVQKTGKYKWENKKLAEVK